MTTSSELPQFLRDMIASPPRHGDGVHQWLFRVSRQLHAHRDPEAIVNLLAASVEGCGRRVPESEIRQAVESSRAVAWQPSGTTGAVRADSGKPNWPERADSEIRALAEACPDAFDRLRESTPVHVSPRLHDAECILERLFPGDPLLCVADGVASAQVARRTEIVGASEASLIVPSPMSKTTGTNKEGRPSVRCLDNTGPRHYIVTEFDQGSKDTQSAVIGSLARLAPLVMVVDSGGKSLHAWWHCKGQPKDRVARFFRHAVRLGADRATWTRCQLVRMPLGLRDGETRQLVHYFDHANAQWRKEERS